MIFIEIKTLCFCITEFIKTHCEKVIASHFIYHFSTTLLKNKIRHEHLSKILYIHPKNHGYYLTGMGRLAPILRQIFVKKM